MLQGKLSTREDCGFIHDPCHRAGRAPSCAPQEQLAEHPRARLARAGGGPNGLILWIYLPDCLRRDRGLAFCPYGNDVKGSTGWGESFAAGVSHLSRGAKDHRRHTSSRKRPLAQYIFFLRGLVFRCSGASGWRLPMSRMSQRPKIAGKEWASSVPH